MSTQSENGFSCFVEFHVSAAEQLEKICHVIEALHEDRQNGCDRDHASYLPLFDDVAIDRFSWPLDGNKLEALDAHQHEIRSAPLAGVEPTHGARWRLGSLIESFLNADYLYMACRKTAACVGRVEFEPGGFPYGGTAPIWGVIEALGGRVVAEDDGERYRQV